MIRLTEDQAKKAGLTKKKRGRWQGKRCPGNVQAAHQKRLDAKSARKSKEDAFDALCASWGLPRPVHEYTFATEIGRKWRFDHLFDGWLAVEQVGGVWTGGHHSGGKDQIDDMERRNHAVLLGYSVLEFTPQQFDDGSAFAFIKKVLEGGQP